MNLKELYARISLTKKKKKKPNPVSEFLTKYETEIVSTARELLARGQFDLKRFLKAMNAFAIEKGVRKEIRKDGKIYYVGLQIKRADLENFLKARGVLK